MDENASASVAGSNVLIIGFGAAGIATGRVLHAMGAKVTGIRRENMEVPDFAEAVCTPDALPRLLPEADIIMMALPYTKETDKLLSRELIACIKQGAYLVNIGRGKTIDQAALTEALRDGRLAGAGLDVFEVEPLPQDDPLWTLPNVLIMPHVAGRDYMPLALKRNIGLFKKNLARFLSGEPLLQVVDREVGYNPMYGREIEL